MLISRVAEAIFWGNRYVERADNTARLIDVSLGLMLDTPIGQREDWSALVETTGDEEWFAEHYGLPTPEAVTQFLTFDTTYPSSILAALTRARDNAQGVREVIPRRMWQTLNELYQLVRDASRREFSADDMTHLYEAVMMRIAQYQGLSSTGLSRGAAWHWSRLGQMLERADQTSRILDVKYTALLQAQDASSQASWVGWTALLDSVGALQTYRQQHRDLVPEDIAAFLLFDRQFPRSIRFCVTRARASLRRITGAAFEPCGGDTERALGRLAAKIAFDRPADALAAGLSAYVQDLQTALNAVGTATQEFFAEPS